ncbi:MAG: hypothetical protein JNL01_11715 [Bdellovibrionales bacterium]|nr:hypothetical protein [Bdellovibrionales bacterium]
MKVYRTLVVGLTVFGLGSVVIAEKNADAFLGRKAFQKWKAKRAERKAAGKPVLFGKLGERLKQRRADRSAAKDQCKDQKGFAKIRCVQQTVRGMRQDRRAENGGGAFANFRNGQRMLGRGIQNGNITAQEQADLQAFRNANNTQRQDLRQQYMSDGRMSVQERIAFQKQMYQNNKAYRHRVRDAYRSPAGQLQSVPVTSQGTTSNVGTGGQDGG